MLPVIPSSLPLLLSSVRVGPQGFGAEEIGAHHLSCFICYVWDIFVLSPGNFEEQNPGSWAVGLQKLQWVGMDRETFLSLKKKKKGTKKGSCLFLVAFFLFFKLLSWFFKAF